MPFLTQMHLDRRTFLRGAGVTLALPFLESMLPAGRLLGQGATARPTRLACIYFPHGAIMPRWTPATDGADFELSDILRPLKAFQDRITVVSDLECALAYGSGATANHTRSAAAFLTGAFAKSGTQPTLGISVDQIVAKQIGQETPLPSLELTIEEPSVNCGDGLSCSYRDTISWQGDSAPLPMEYNPQVVFERVFGDGATNAERKLRREQSLSLLDSITGEAKSLSRRLPSADRTRLDQYLGDVREIERRIQKAGEQLSDDVAVPPAPIGIPSDIEEHVRLMYDLQALAWQADITRVSTLLLAKELSNAVYPKSTVRDAFHILSHHSNIQANKDRFAILNTYHAALFGYFLQKLASTPDGDGTLLDHAIVLYGSGMSDGNQHNHTDLPIVVAGGASGRLRGGRHIRNAKKTPMSNLLLAMLDMLNVEAERFGDSTGRVEI